MPTVLYSIAHSDPRRPSGAVTAGGVTENMVALDASAGLKMRLDTAAIRCERFSGPLAETIDRMQRAISALQKIGEQHVSLELHFNNPPIVPCWKCKELRYKGRTCDNCGTQARRPWRIGHTAMVSRWAPSSVQLAECILARLSEVLPWSRRRKPIKMPDSRYGPKVWPESMYPPAVLVEAGFGCDPLYAAHVQEKAGRLVLGMALADGVIDFVRQTSGARSDAEEVCHVGKIPIA